MSPRRVLIVDDDESIRAVLDHNLREIGLEVAEAEDAEAGWRRFREEAPDLVITDVRMAGMSGMDLLRRVLDAAPGAIVIVITAYGSVREAVEAVKAGAYDYVTKPFDREAFKLTVKKALAYAHVRLENRALRAELSERFTLSKIVGESPPMRALFKTLARIAASDATVLIEGETGTGKELVARAIHYGSSRASRNFVTVNCTAIPRELLESELFGHEKGAFTGATRARTGKFELAHGGTVFLDEIGDIDFELQKKLLRVLQQREIDKVGAAGPTPVDVRIIAATNRSLASLVEEGSFRQDLFYRLSVVPVRLPPLRERAGDLPALVDHFLEAFGASGVCVTEAAMERLGSHPWPGNVRELENAIERALILREDPGRIDADDISLPEAPATPAASAPAEGSLRLPDEGLVMDDVERDLILEALERSEGNQTAAARLLGMTRQTLIYRMQKHGIRRGRS